MEIESNPLNLFHYYIVLRKYSNMTLSKVQFFFVYPKYPKTMVMERILTLGTEFFYCFELGSILTLNHIFILLVTKPSIFSVFLNKLFFVVSFHMNLMCDCVFLWLQWLRKTNRKPLLEALEKMREGSVHSVLLETRVLFDLLVLI